MDTLTSLDDYIGRAGNEPEEVPKAGSLAAAVSYSKASSDPLSKHDFVANDRSDTKLNRQVSKSIFLEPPPVISRPPKTKDDSFGLGALSWLFWKRTEEKDVSPCSRSTHKSYTHETIFRFLGFNMTKNITFKISDGELDTAVETIRLGWFSFETTWVHDRLPKARARFEQMGILHFEAEGAKSPNASGQEDNSVADVERQNEPTQGAPSAARARLHEHYYVVLGFMSGESVPKETLRRVRDTDGLFREIRKAKRHLRNPLRRAMSLKEVSGFGIYECDPTKGYHKEVELDRETERALAELWRSYCGHKLDYGGRWLMWIHEHFNNGSKNPEVGRLALEFKLRWSVFKVVFWGILPVLLSLAIGFWYMYSEHEGVDDVAAAEAAWVIATYIVTTSALLLALLAIITQFGDI